MVYGILMLNKLDC